MRPFRPVSGAAQVAVAALVLLGLVGGSLIIAHAGFSTSPKRGGPSIFVPAPEAYVLAALMYAMSVIALVVLLQARRASPAVMALGLGTYAAVAALLSATLVPG